MLFAIHNISYYDKHPAKKHVPWSLFIFIQRVPYVSTKYRQIIQPCFAIRNTFALFALPLHGQKQPYCLAQAQGWIIWIIFQVSHSGTSYFIIIIYVYNKCVIIFLACTFVVCTIELTMKTFELNSKNVRKRERKRKRKREERKKERTFLFPTWMNLVNSGDHWGG